MDTGTPTPPASLDEYLRDQFAAGTRGFIFGEYHNHVGIAQALAARMPALHAAGARSLYVEYLPTQEQPLLDKALAGDGPSQLKILTQLEDRYSYSRESAQARYDLLFAARDAGLRVIGIDTPDSRSPLMYDFLGVRRGELPPERFSIGDAVMARNIRTADDGAPFIVVAGSAHTQHADIGGLNDIGLPASLHGGIDGRLRAAGIPVVAIDLDPFGKGLTVVYPSLHSGTDARLILPDEPNRTRIDPALAIRGAQYRLVGITASLALRPEAGAAEARLAASAATLESAFNSCADTAKIRHTASAVMSNGHKVARRLEEPNERAQLETWLRNTAPLADPKQKHIIDNNRQLCAGKNSQRWLRPPPGPR